jgi:hypothetical protein
MNTRGILNNGDTITYALGQDIDFYKGLKFISHGGADAGYRSFVGRFPDQRFSVIIFSNNGNFDPSDIALKVAGIYLKDKFLPEKSTPEPAPVLTNVGVINADPVVLKSYNGNFQLRPGFNIAISSEGANLFVEAHEVGRRQLTQLSASEFTLPELNAKLTFIPDQDGKVNTIDIVLNGQPLKAFRLADVDMSTINMSDYAGDYYSPELNTTYTFVVDKDKLVVSHQRLDDFQISITRKDQFSTGDWFFNQVDFTRDADNYVNGCSISSGKVKGIAFQKVN